MALAQDNVTRVAFGLFEADLSTGELWKAGRKVKLQSQPFKVMTALLEHEGEVISRDTLQARLWGKDAVGDLDHSLITAINKIREALGDTADNPRFVETLARRGYRWIAPITVLGRYPVELQLPVTPPELTISGSSATVPVLPETVSVATYPVPLAAPSGPTLSPTDALPRERRPPRGLLGAALPVAGILIGLGAWLQSRLAAPASPLLRIEQLERIS